MPTQTGTNVKFVKVQTKQQYTDYQEKDGALIFVENERKIYVDEIAYGFSDADVANKFLELAGGTMLGNINMGNKDVKNVKEIEFKYQGSEATAKFEQHADVFAMVFPGLSVTFNAGGINLIGEGSKKIKGLADPTATDEAVTLNYLNTNVINKKGVADGFAGLNEHGVVPSTQLPSYVDDVVEYSAKASFPDEGESGKLYIDLSNGHVWRWGGSAYVYVADGNAHLTLGTVAGTAFEGDLGKEAHDHSLITGANPHGVSKFMISLGNVENYGIASQTHAEEGTVTNKYMTPSTTKYAIEALAPRLTWEVV